MGQSDKWKSICIDLAEALVKVPCKLLLGPFDSVADPVTKLIRQKVEDTFDQRSLDRFLSSFADIMAKKLHEMLAEEYSGLPAYEVNAAVLAARDAIEKSDVSAETVLRAGQDPRQIYAHIMRSSDPVLRGMQLREGGTALYERVLYESSAYLIELINAMPGIERLSLREVLKQQVRIIRDFEVILDRLPKAQGVHDFLGLYRRTVARELDRMELFGLQQIGPSTLYPLSIAYVSLTAVRHPRARSATSAVNPSSTGLRIEDALRNQQRVMLIGEAGTGKTTLLRWLAVRSALSEFLPPLNGWNTLVPIYLPLRRFATGDFPPPERFLDAVADLISGQMPPGWVHEILGTGQALVLLDGIDELPAGAVREAARDWLTRLTTAFPKATYIVTTRPAAIAGDWLDSSFGVAELQPMSSEHVKIFVAKWHDAIKKSLTDSQEIEQLPAHERSLSAAIEADRHLRAMAVNPLLCALLCALNRKRSQRLPKERMEIYGAALEMLLEARDQARGVYDPGLPRKVKLDLLEDLALWLMRQGRPELPREEAKARLAHQAGYLGLDQWSDENLLQLLLERSGLLSELTVGQISFVHRTFQDYLAARAAIRGQEISFLANHALNDQWRDVIVMAAGHAQPPQLEALLHLLIEAARKLPPDDKRLDLLTVACLQTNVKIEPTLRAQIQAIAKKLIPPRTVDEALSLAAGGEFVLDILNREAPTNTLEAQASLRLISLVGDPESLPWMSRIAADFPGSRNEVLRAWAYFDLAAYARTVIYQADIGQEFEITDSAILPYTGYMRSVRILRLDTRDLASFGSLGDPPPNLAHLTVFRKAKMTLKGLDNWTSLASLRINCINTCPSLEPLESMRSLKKLHIAVNQSIGLSINLRPLGKLRSLRELVIFADSEYRVDLSPFSTHERLLIQVLRHAQLSRVPTGARVRTLDQIPPELA